MKTLLQWQFAFIAGLLLFVNNSFAQISYSEGFNEGLANWDNYLFDVSTDAPCAGAGSLSANLYFFDPEAQLISPTVGTSNGGEITLSYQYKIIDYDGGAATTNDQDWGFIEIYYATSANGPFTLLQTIDPANHVESTSCATKTVSFFAPQGSEVYIGVYAANTSFESDYYVYFDEVQVSQAAPITCSGVPAVPQIVASNTALCETGTATLSISNVYTDIGITYQWQSSVDNVTFTDIAGATASTYIVSQQADTFYRVVVSCTASEESVQSTAVEITETGLACVCDVTFLYDIEPITRVVFAGIDNSSSGTLNGTPARQDFSAITPAEVTQGSSYPIALEGNTVGDFINYFTVFIDFNQDGDFSDEGETFEIGSIENSTGDDGQQATGTIAIPMDAATGLTNMRVFKLYNRSTTDACESEVGFSYGQVEDYLIDVSEFVAGTDAFSANNFKYYPNPVTNILNVSFVKNITGIEVYNLLGQTVLNKTVDQNSAQIDMSSLSAGTYMVKVATEGASKTIKVIKQ